MNWRRALAACALITACGGDARLERRPDAAGGTITILYPSTEWVLGPSSDDSPKFLMFLPLANPAVGGRCGDVVGSLAERWEHSPNYRVWTVWLRAGPRWHDGVPVTAADIKFTIDLLNHPDVRNYNAEPVDSAVVLGDRVVRFFLRKPDRWPIDGWPTFYPKHLLDTLDPGGFYEWEFWTRPVGNGPYRYVRHTPQTMVELEANPDYFAGRPRIGRVVLKFVAAGSGSGLLELRSGNADLAATRSLVEARELADDPRYRVYYPVSSSHTRWLVYNPRFPALSDRRVRRALTMAIDRRALHEALAFPPGVPVTDAPYSSCQFQRRELVPPLPADRSAARELLREVGWRDADGDGVVERNGVPLRFTVLVAPREEAAAVIVQDHLRRIGVRVEIARLDGSIVRQRVFAGDFEAAIPPMVGVEEYLARESGLAAVYPRVIALVRARQGEPDLERLEALTRQLQEAFLAERPATFLYPLVEALVAHRRIQGIERDGRLPPGWRWPFGDLESMWIEEPRDRQP